MSNYDLMEHQYLFLILMTPDSDSPQDSDLSSYYLHQHDIATAPCEVCPKFVQPIYGYLVILTSSNDVLLYSIKH